MGWYKRGTKRYYFRSVRDGDTVGKIYFGAGPVAEMAAQADRIKQYEKQREHELWKQQQALIEDAVHAYEELHEGADLLRDAELLTAGFHRWDRHQWQGWIDGRKTRQSD
jgi:hypothetical protein